jgi:hypothetical protein
MVNTIRMVNQDGTWSGGRVKTGLTRMLRHAGVLLYAGLLIGCTFGNEPGSPSAAGTPTAVSSSVGPSAGSDRDLEACLLGTWTHAYEEDTHQAVVYRPASDRLPPSRGREGFEFRAGGVLIYHGIAPADGPELVRGRWTVLDRRVELDIGDTKSMVLDVLTCEATKLTVKA